MRFKKGNKVEIFTKKNNPCGAWLSGEIVSGNGHYYHVRNDSGALGTVRVSRKVLRPLPPPVFGLRDWMPGDLVEVFERMSWKPAMVSNVVGGNFFMVRLLGSSQSVRAHKSDVRVRQFWKHDGWLMIGNGFGISEDGKSHSSSCQMSKCEKPRAGGKRKLQGEDNYVPFGGNIYIPEVRMVSSRTLMRGSPTGMSCLEAYTGSGHKRRAPEKKCRRFQSTTEHSSSLREKVDAVTSPKYMLGEKHMRTSFYNQIYRMDTEKAEPNGDVEYFPGRILELSEAGSASSVGSCSSSSSPYSLPYCSPSNPNSNSHSFGCDSYSSDAESIHGWKPEKSHSLISKDDGAVETHELELHAYRCTMRALYISGNLSWEQEELMTNLRLALHISNDEHLLEIRNLICGKEKPTT